MKNFMMLTKQKANKKLLIWIIQIAVCIHYVDSTKECCFNSSFFYRDNQEVLLYGFDRFDQLAFDCAYNTEMSVLSIQPNKDLILDNSFNFQ